MKKKSVGVVDIGGGVATSSRKSGPAGNQLRDVTTTTIPIIRFLSEFIAPHRNSNVSPVTLSDVCSGNLDHINLRHVSRLESLLHKLYQGEICGRAHIISSQQHC